MACGCHSRLPERLVDALKNMTGQHKSPEAFNPGEADADALARSHIARLLKGFDLAIADGSATALRRALDEFHLAILLDETRPEAYIGLGLCYLNLGDAARGLRYFDGCLERGFGSGAYASLTYEFDDRGGQTQSFEIDLDTVLGWRATCHLARHAPEAAARELAHVSREPALELRPGLAVLRGRLCLAEGDLVGAQRQLGEALAWDPDEPDAHFLRGQLHEHRGNIPAALRAYTRAIRIDPDEVDFRIARATLRIAAGDHKQAAKDLAAAQRQLAAQFPQPGMEALLSDLRKKTALG